MVTNLKGKKPNILFLMSDEHRADIAGFAGNKIVRTPVLDKLAAEAVLFQNAYTPSPICIPARQCMMAGQFPRHCGVERYGQDLTPGYMTFARRLAQYGYQTVVSGKLHHMGVDQMQGWTRRISGDMHVDERFVTGRLDQEQQVQEKQPKRGNLQKWSEAKEIARAGVGRGPCISHDEYAVAGAKQFIEDYFNSPYYDREKTNPLLLKVSLLQPHYPYLTSEEKFNYYLNRVEPYMDEQVSNHPFLQQRQVQPGVDITKREVRRATAAYYGMIETIDDFYGQIITALAQVGQNIDDWIIIYTSDHGEMLGQHGIWEKQKFYEASVRVPLFIRYPKHFKASKVDENVNLCDLFATLCDLSDSVVPEGLDSRSLVPLMAKADEKSAVDWTNESISQFGGTNLMIKYDHLKYQYYGEQMPEVLFDLAVDSGERNNVIDEPKYSAALQQFRNRAKELQFGL
ncbi:sulfatase-like hydrolase/transferase [Paenibacillus yanchengensis]|uniref:Sulfatase-like hydrolase/transferase n=1 Tax=Paenibacillus yanchengensis TaxID=2035833 RepID=A0ABW4YMD3_9BACL